MDLEKLNKQYLALKNRLKAEKTKIETEKKNIKTKETQKLTKLGDKKILEGEYDKAKINKDKNLMKSKKSEIEDVDKDIEKLDSEIGDIKDIIKIHENKIKGLEEQINDKLKELQENPELKKHIEEVMIKKYERQVKNGKDGKEKSTGKKEKIEKLQKLVEKRPAVKNYLIGIMNSTNEVNKLNEDLKKMGQTDPKALNIKRKLIPDLEEKIKKNKELLLGIKALDFKEEDLEELLKSGIIVNKNGKIDLTTTLNKRKAQLNREIKRYTESIANHEEALKTFGRSTELNTKTAYQQQSQTRNMNSEPNLKPEPIKSSDAEQENSSDPLQQSYAQQEEKTKWYQFIKKFKNWNEKRKQKALTSGEPLKEQEPVQVASEPIQGDNSQKENSFRNSLKYEIVNDLYNDIDKKIINDVKNKRKEANVVQQKNDGR